MLSLLLVLFLAVGMELKAAEESAPKEKGGKTAIGGAPQVTLDQAAKEEAQLQALLLQAQQKKKMAQERLDKQNEVQKKIDDSKIQEDSLAKQLKDAEGLEKQTETDYNALEKDLAKESEGQKPLSESVNTKTEEKAALEKLIAEKNAELKKLQSQIDADKKSLNSLQSKNANLTKKVQVKKSSH